MKIDIQNNLKGLDALFILSDSKTIPTTSLPARIKADIADFTKKFDGKKTVHFVSKNGAKPIHIHVIGTKKDDCRKISYNIGKTATSKKYENVGIMSKKYDHQILADEFIFANYKFDTYLTGKDSKQHNIKKLAFIQKTDAKLLKELKKTQHVAESVNYVRDLVNSPATDITPSHLASEARKIAKKGKKITVKIMSEKELKKEKLNLILGVSAGSTQDAKLVKLTYKNKPKNKQPIMIVGKGVTFDAGGLNIKTSWMEAMKMDMAGAATVLGLFKILEKYDVPAHIIGLVPTTENLLGGTAYKPGDIIKSYSGKTIEINNTDAEGRLILADALAYGTKKFKPECIIDMATLTGACITALGNTRSGLITNNHNVRDQILEASEGTGNEVWPLPLDKFHQDKVKGNVSDYKNLTSGVGAGASMAGAFLEKFVSDTPWVHLDIAGTAFMEKAIPGKPLGGTGDPLKLLFKFIENYKTPK